MSTLSIKNWEITDRPREKSLTLGIKTLSNSELLAIIIGSGYKEKTAVDLAKEMLASVKNNLNTLSAFSETDFIKFKGIGPAKAVNIKAALELGIRNNYAPTNTPIALTTSKLAYRYIYPFMHHLDHEQVWLTCLANDYKPIHNFCLSKGSTNASLVDLKIVCKTAINQLANAVILYHDHPSGNTNPSKKDIELTRQIQKALKVFNIKLADHLIVSNGKYLSFADKGLL